MWYIFRFDFNNENFILICTVVFSWKNDIRKICKKTQAVLSWSWHDFTNSEMQEFSFTGYSFWDRLRNFLHKFTWIFLSVHKLNKLDKFWLIYGQLLNIMSSYGWYEKSLLQSHNYQPVPIKVGIQKSDRILKNPPLLSDSF